MLPSGQALVAGGANACEFHASAELYDPITGTWSAIGSMSVPRANHSATLLPNGKVMVAGGVGGSGAELLASAELYTSPDAASQISVVIYVVNSFPIALGTQTSLDAKLQTALTALGSGNSTAACKNLTAFTNEVWAQARHGLTTSQANELLDEANRLEAVLGC